MLIHLFIPLLFVLLWWVYSSTFKLWWVYSSTFNHKGLNNDTKLHTKDDKGDIVQPNTVTTPDQLVSPSDVTIAKHIEELHSHCFNGYMEFAFPADELKPISCTPRHRDPEQHDEFTLGNFSLTLIDSLDSLIIFGKVPEFIRAVQYISSDNISLNSDLLVSTFETNIRVLGGLLSGHVLSTSLSLRLSQIRNNRNDGINTSHLELENLPPSLMDFEYHGELLEKGIFLGRRLQEAFNTKSGLPLSRINLRYGAQPERTSEIISTAESGTFLIEFGILSLLTGDPSFYWSARNATMYMWNKRSKLDLVGSLWNIHTGEILSPLSGIGAGIDSFFEYLFKAGILFGDVELTHAFNKASLALRRYCQWRGAYFSCEIESGQITGFPKMNALGAFWPGVLFNSGFINEAIQTYTSFLRVWMKYDALPEAGEPIEYSRGYPLRPEFYESTFILSNAMNSSLEIQKSVITPGFLHFNGTLRTKCGVASQPDVKNLNELSDNMESFFISETLVYLYLSVVDSNIINQRLPASLDQIVFSTEAHLFPLPFLYPKLYVGRGGQDGINEVQRRLCIMTNSIAHCKSKKLETNEGQQNPQMVKKIPD